VRFFFFLFAMLVHDVIYFGIYTGGELGAFAKQFLFVAIPSALYITIVMLLLDRDVSGSARRSS